MTATLKDLPAPLQKTGGAGTSSVGHKLARERLEQLISHP